MRSTIQKFCGYAEFHPSFGARPKRDVCRYDLGVLEEDGDDAGGHFVCHATKITLRGKSMLQKRLSYAIYPRRQ